MLAGGTSLAAQRSAGLRITLPDPISRVTVDGPVVTAHDMLAGSRIRENLAAGFPARFHFRVELWSAGVLHNLERSLEYDVLVRYIALEKAYQVWLLDKDVAPFSLGKYTNADDAERAVVRPRRVPITAPAVRRSMYYRVTLAADNLQLSDLDELNRWVRGEVQPAISGDRNAGTGISRALRSILLRVLGGSTSEYAETSKSFQLP